MGRPIDGYYEVDTSLLDDLFDPAYVEFVDPEGAGDPVPYREYVVTGQNEEDDLRLFSQMWFANKQSRQDDWLSPDPGRDDFDTGKENYFHLIGACKKKDGDNANGTSNWSMNAAYIWVGSIGAQPVVVRETVCHEIGHQFDIVLTMVIVVAGHVTGVAALYHPRRVGEPVPDRLSLAVGRGRALDLIGCRGCPPEKILGKT